MHGKTISLPQGNDLRGAQPLKQPIGGWNPIEAIEVDPLTTSWGKSCLTVTSFLLRLTWSLYNDLFLGHMPFFFTTLVFWWGVLD
jgi:hypothetical protein